MGFPLTRSYSGASGPGTEQAYMQKLKESNRSVLGGRVIAALGRELLGARRLWVSSLRALPARCLVCSAEAPSPSTTFVISLAKGLEVCTIVFDTLLISATINTNHRTWLSHVCPQHWLRISPTILFSHQDWFNLLKLVLQPQGCSYSPVSLRYFTMLALVRKSLLLSLSCFMDL